MSFEEATTPKAESPGAIRVDAGAAEGDAGDEVAQPSGVAADVGMQI